MHEAQMHDHNQFLTLTYSDDALIDGALRVRDYQLFMKRLRKAHGAPVRYYHCGEYGDTYLRPHYHACVFGLEVNDRKLYTRHNGNNIYTSASLERIWGHGFVTLGNLTFQSAAYTARYVMKKLLGGTEDDYREQYMRFDELGPYWVPPEYTTMSNGIGEEWLNKYKGEFEHDDTIIMNGVPMRPPKFYDRKLEELHMEKVKARRKRAARKHKDNQTTERLRTREVVKAAQTQNLRRSYET